MTPCESGGSDPQLAWANADLPDLLARLRERIVAFAASRYTKEHAEDLAQETLMVIHEKYGHLERMEDLVPVAFQILRFKLGALRRKVWRHGEHQQSSVDDVPLHTDALDPEAMAMRQEMLDRLSNGLALMGKRCQDIFRLKLQGRSFPEICTIMGATSLNTVYTWDHRCRKQLLEWMGGRWEA